MAPAGTSGASTDPASITYLKWVQLDTPMMLLIVVLLTSLIVGLATAFLGLAYEHEHLHIERHRSLDEPTRPAVR